MYIRSLGLCQRRQKYDAILWNGMYEIILFSKALSSTSWLSFISAKFDHQEHPILPHGMPLLKRFNESLYVVTFHLQQAFSICFSKAPKLAFFSLWATLDLNVTLRKWDSETPKCSQPLRLISCSAVISIPI